MTKAIAIVALAGFATAASADIFSTAGPVGPSAGAVRGGSTYQLDDGNSENSLGLTNGGYMVATNQFNVTGGNNVITSIEVTWGTDDFAGSNGVVAGSAIDIFIWSQNSGSTDPTGNATLLFSGVGTISAGAIDNNVFQTIAVPNVVIPTGAFFIGVGQNHAAGTFPFSLDASAPQLGRSWALGGTGWNPNAPAFNGAGALDVAGLGFGNFMVRGTAVPAPGAMALLGLSGLIAGRRRR